MADAEDYRNFGEHGGPAVAAALVVSPLLNLAPARASGPTLIQHRPILPLGRNRLSGTARLSLAPDRQTVEVTVSLDGGAAPSSIRLRRVAGHDLRGAGRPYGGDLLVAEVISGTTIPDRPIRFSEQFALGDRGSFPPFERLSELRQLGIGLSELTASSVDGLRVEAAPAASKPGQSAASYLTARLLMEIEAAEHSDDAVTACRHLELANLYARRLAGPVKSQACPCSPP